MIAAVAGLFAFGGARPAQALTIVPHFGTGMTAGAQAVVNTAIAFYNSTFVDPITVDIEFHNMGSGLGASLKPIYSPLWTSYEAALLADATSADDATANASLTVADAGGISNDPVHNKANISISPANGRAVGLPTPAVLLGPGNTSGFCTVTLILDGCIGLRLSITDLAVADGGGGPGGFHLMSVIEHEIDEILGGNSSGLSANGTIFLDQASTTDLFRWAGAGVRSFATNAGATTPCPGATPAAFFSINGGVTNLNQYNNCNNGGDYGDWITHTPSQVGDAFTNNSGNPELDANSPETRNLDVIGYTRVQVVSQVPEPASLALLGSGLVGAVAFRRRAQRRK